MPEGFVEKPIPSYLHCSVSSIYLCVCLYSVHSPSAVEDDQYFSEVSFQFQACLFPLSTSRILRWATPGASVLAEVCAYMHSSGHICMDTHSIMQPKPILPPQLTQLGQQTALHNFPNYPAAPCLVQLPLSAMLIYNEAHVTVSSISTHSAVHTHTNSTPRESTHSSICVSVPLVASQQWGCVSAGLVLPQSLPPAATYPSWSVTVNKKIQSPAYVSHMA